MKLVHGIFTVARYRIGGMYCSYLMARKLTKTNRKLQYYMLHNNSFSSHRGRKGNRDGVVSSQLSAALKTVNRARKRLMMSRYRETAAQMYSS